MHDTPIMPLIQKRVKSLMAARHVSVADLAARTGRQHSDVRRSLCEAHWWRLDRFVEYAEALEVGAQELFPAELRIRSALTGNYDRITSGSPASRIAAASAAGITAQALNAIGARNRRNIR